MKELILIDKVIDLRSGEIINSEDIIGSDKTEQQIFQLRTKIEECIQNDENYLVCAYCSEKIKLRSSGKDNKYQMHFAHLSNSDDCPIKTKTILTKEEIQAIQYNGAKESFLLKK